MSMRLWLTSGVLVGLGVAVIIHLIIVPSLEGAISMPTWEAILASVIGLWIKGWIINSKPGRCSLLGDSACCAVSLDRAGAFGPRPCKAGLFADEGRLQLRQPGH